MAPPDLEAAEQQLFLGADSSDGDKESDASDCSSLQDFEGDESILDKGQDASAASASQGHSHVKQYHLSPEWQHLESLGAHLVCLPPIVGAGVNRHPAGKFWSARFPGHSIQTASWSEARSPFRCLVHCLRHVIKLHVEHGKPSNAETWNEQLRELKKYLWARRMKMTTNTQRLMT